MLHDKFRLVFGVMLSPDPIENVKNPELTNHDKINLFELFNQEPEKYAAEYLTQLTDKALKLRGSNKLLEALAVNEDMLNAYAKLVNIDPSQWLPKYLDLIIRLSNNYLEINNKEKALYIVEEHSEALCRYYSEQPNQFALAYTQVLVKLAYLHRSHWHLIKMYKLIFKALSIADKHNIDRCKVVMKC
ncbi:MAG: hypothetical protein JHC38_07490 [Thiotrichales bacterium]|jgi:hypothetical protein|nr:hypothetical protein [Thiotrichales bacterium]